MRILLVEDERDYAEEVLSEISRFTPPPTLDLVGNRAEAVEFLEKEFYDLLVLDLRIPTTDLSLDADSVHGLHVFTHARQVAPGMPILILTGSSADEFIPTLLDAARRVNVWGSGEISTVQFLKKINLADLTHDVGPLVSAVNMLSSIEVHSPEYDLALPYSRLIRIFARRTGVARCVVKPLGGLSGAQVLRIRMTDEQGALVHNAVAKLGPLRDILDESHRFDTHVARLAAAATPRKLAVLDYGAKAAAAIFYQLAPNFDGTAFDAALWETKASGRVAASLEEMTAAWSAGSAESRRSVKEIRERLLCQEDYARIVAEVDLDWADDFERGTAQCIWCCVHGDLHGENALVSSDGSAVLIDYGDVGAGPRSLDPISLEFSLLFHPKSPLVNGLWPSEDQARRWFDLDAYLVDCPVPEFVAATRNWAERAAVGPREIAATAYAYLIRQLKYPTTDGSRALQLLDGARTLFAKT